MNSTSTSNSTFPSVLSGAAAGGAAGMGLALATKPYLKNGKPNSRLFEEMGVRLVCLEPEYKTIMENSAKIADEIKALADDKAVDAFIKSGKVDLPEEALKHFKSATSVEEKKLILNHIAEIDTHYDVLNVVKKIKINDLFQKFKDKSKDLTEEQVKVISDAVKKQKTRYAIIFSAIGAAAVGLTTFFVKRNKTGRLE